MRTYYNIGKMLNEAGKQYGEGVIKKYSIKSIEEVDKKYNTTNLKRMRQFYHTIEKGAPFGHQLSWSHYRELLSIKNISEVQYYINICETLKLTRDELKFRIKSDEKYNYIDLLLFNYEYNCFVVIELKITELKKNVLAKYKFI